MDKEQAIQEILNDLEHQPLQKSRTFQAYLSQPELISLSSTNAQPQSAPISSQTDNSYFNFTVNLPRPALNVKSLQLLKSIIPQAQCSIPDYSLVFPYYKLKTVPIDQFGTLHFITTPLYDGDPNKNTLFYIALLPSNYKPEYYLINPTSPAQYGYNKTFNDYNELLVELNKACISNPIRLDSDVYNFITGDISFIFSEKYNKFVFQGNNVSIPNTYPLWDSETLYQVGDVVKYNDIVYYCQEIPQGDPQPFPPSDPEAWRNISVFFDDYPQFNTYFVAGYNDPNVSELLQNIQTVTETEYFNGFNHLTSITGNKYVQGQTLARRLGFTWDGTGMLTDTINIIKGGIDFGGTTAIFYNRLRPIPSYYRRDGGEEVGIIGNTTIDKYTADGYCNLVYSSVISIYTIIVGTSSVDTQRNANLLAMVEMNAGNLGIAMGSAYIDTKLTKIQPDIYNIYIELRDEVGQPYYLTNNAVSTFLIKLTYD